VADTDGRLRDVVAYAEYVSALIELTLPLGTITRVPWPEAHDRSPWPTGNSGNGTGQPCSRL